MTEATKQAIATGKSIRFNIETLARMYGCPKTVMPNGYVICPVEFGLKCTNYTPVECWQFYFMICDLNRVERIAEAGGAK